LFGPTRRWASPSDCEPAAADMDRHDPVQAHYHGARSAQHLATVTAQGGQREE